MTSAEHGVVTTRAPRLVTASLVAVVVGLASLAPPASGDVVRVTRVTPDDDRQPTTASVATFPVTARGGRAAEAPLTGLEDPDVLLPSPDGGSVATLGTTGGSGDEEQLWVGVFSLAGGAVRTFGAPRDADDDTDAFPADGDGALAWLSWAPSGASVVVHGLTSGRADPWFGPPVSRRCAVDDLRCAPARGEDVIDLPGGGTVRVRAGITAPVGTGRTLDGTEGRRAGRAFLRRADRRFAVEVRVSGRPGTPAAWKATGVLRRGAPAYDRAYPSTAGVLVRTSTVRGPSSREVPVSGASALPGRAVVVRSDGRIRSVGRLPFDVVGTLPDGRWLLAGGAEKPFPRGPAGEPLRTLDADGTIRPLESGGAPITPVRVANAAGLPDTQAQDARIGEASVDPATGLLVLQLVADNGAPFDAVVEQPLVAVSLDGAAPPFLIRPPASVVGAGVTERFVVR